MSKQVNIASIFSVGTLLGDGFTQRGFTANCDYYDSIWFGKLGLPVNEGSEWFSSYF